VEIGKNGPGILGVKLHRLKSKYIFIENSKKMRFQPKRGFEKSCF
jgi:hypothetical protein